MAFALNNHRGIHSNAYAKAVCERLKGVVNDGRAEGLPKAEITAELQRELLEMRKILEEGKIFWPGY